MDLTADQANMLERVANSQVLIVARPSGDATNGIETAKSLIDMGLCIDVVGNEVAGSMRKVYSKVVAIKITPAGRATLDVQRT